MNTISWLHLSDWHQKGEDFDRRVIRDALVKDIENRTAINLDLKNIDFIFFTGDIAFSGKNEEYEAAVKQMFDPVFKALGLSKANGWKSTYVIPGNHDFDRDEYIKITKQFNIEINNSQTANSALLNNAIKPALLSPFKGFNNFVRKYLKKTLNVQEPAYSFLKIQELKNKKVGILGLNSAWHCSRQHNKNGDIFDYGNLIIGEAQIHEQLQESDKCDFVIALTHHPFNWLNDFDRDLIEEKLTRHCHFILHGHQHLPRVNVITSTLGDTILIPGGASYDRRKPEDPRYTNSYNFVTLNLDDGSGKVFLRKWNEKQEKWNEDTDLVDKGIFSFTATKDRILTHSEKIEARKKLLTRFNLPLKKRFFDEMSLSIKHSLVNIQGVDLVRHEMYYSFKISAGLPEEFVWETFSDDRVGALIRKHSLNIEPYSLEYFKIGGKNVNPIKKTDQNILFKTQIGQERVVVKYKYILYLRSDDIYKIHLFRFTHNFKMTFQGDKKIRYNFFPIGGFPNLLPKEHAIFDYHEIELDDLCFPDQGYMIQWFLPD